MTFPADATWPGDLWPADNRLQTMTVEELWYNVAHEDVWVYVQAQYEAGLIDRPASWPALVRLPYGATLEDYV